MNASGPRPRWLLARLVWAVLTKPLVLAFWALGLIPAAVLIGPALVDASPLAMPFWVVLLLALGALFGLVVAITAAFALLAWRVVQLVRGLLRWGRQRQSARPTAVGEPSSWRAPAPSAESLARESAYDELGLDYGAPPSEVKAAYRRLARSLHPDVSKAPDAAERFQRVKAAYELLTAC